MTVRLEAQGTLAWLRILGQRCPPDRLAEARSYVAIGSVVDLTVDVGVLRGQVQGAASSPYTVEVACRPLDPEAKEQQRDALHDRMGSTDAVFEILCPTVADLRATCSCADWSPLCKHAAALCLAFLDAGRPSRRVDVLTLRGYGPDSEEGAAALAAPRPSMPEPPLPLWPRALSRRGRRKARADTSDALLLPFEDALEAPPSAPWPETPSPPGRVARRTGRSRPRQAAEAPALQLDLWGATPVSTPGELAERITDALPEPLAPPEVSPPAVIAEGAIEAPQSPLRGYWQGGAPAEIGELRPPEELGEAVVMLDVLGPPPWSDKETARAVLAPLWTRIEAHAARMLVDALEARRALEDTLAGRHPLTDRWLD